MKARSVVASVVLGLGGALVFGGCSAAGDADEAESAEGRADQDQIAIECRDAIADVYKAPGRLPVFDPNQRGAVVRCGLDRTISRAQLDAMARSVGYTGPALQSGARVFRIAYRTTRADSWTHDLSSALVLLPTVPVAAKHPLVVAAHGSVGIAEKCAPSRGKLEGDGGFLDDFRSLLLPLAGYGYTVIAPDYAGFGYGSITGWSLAPDEAHSLLDATRAMGKLLRPGTLNGDVVMVGHSQGGHAVLAAHAHALRYELEGRLAGVIAEAPLWIPPRSWGAATTPMAALATDSDSGVGTIAYALTYFYTHGELYDGPGGGLPMFEKDKREAIRKVLTTSCLGELELGVRAIGSKAVSFFDGGFITSVGSCAATGVCVGDTADKWQARFQADRPSISAKGAPVVVWHGLHDRVIPPERAQCGFDSLQYDIVDGHDNEPGPFTELTLCQDPEATHGGYGADARPITRRAAPWINAWIAAKTLGRGKAPACKPWSRTDADGKPLSCPSLPPNKD